MTITAENPSPDDQSIDLSDLEPIPGAGDLADAETARTLADLAYSLVSGDSPDTLDRFMEQPTADSDLLTVAADFADWAAAWMDESFDADQSKVSAFVSELAADLFDQVWPAYDPDGMVPEQTKADAALSFVGASLFWGFMADAEIVPEDKANKWSALWYSIIVDPYIRTAYGAKEPVTEPTQTPTPTPPAASAPVLTTEPPAAIPDSDW
jgi:hypothetical protein